MSTFNQTKKKISRQERERDDIDYDRDRAGEIKPNFLAEFTEGM